LFDPLTVGYGAMTGGEFVDACVAPNPPYEKKTAPLGAAFVDIRSCPLIKTALCTS
jgi:hypothetical protein